ncbi:MAG: kinase [Clostridia bacterium]|nr:kinase [Clostridia bacterium]
MKIGRIIGKITGEKKRREAVSRGGVGQRSKREARAELPPRDYSVYIMSLREAAVGSAAGAAAGFAAVLIMFDSFIPAVIAAIPAGIAGAAVFRKILTARRRRRLLLQFRDTLESLSASFLAGRNIYGAFEDAFTDIGSEHGPDALMTRELAVISAGLKNGRQIDELLSDFAVRSGAEDIRDFADTFSACCITGGDLKQTVSYSRDIIGEKISVGMEIEAAVTAGKNELNILSVMPFAVVTMLKTLGSESVSAGTPENIAVRAGSMVLFAAAYMLGRRITDIRI